MQDRPEIDEVLPDPATVHRVCQLLPKHLPAVGGGLESVKTHLRNDILPALNRASQSPHYYGFVTGGATPAARFADNLVTETDQNVQVHLPHDTICTTLEDTTLRMVCELLNLQPGEWRHRTFTTGATASNLVGLACAREWLIQQSGGEVCSTGSLGLVQAMRKAEIEGIMILTTVPHSSLRKAASIVGLGSGDGTFVDVSSGDAGHRIDLEKLQNCLANLSAGHKAIIAVSCAEVNTGLFATNHESMKAIRHLADRYSAWIHVDAAFGLSARILPDVDTYRPILDGVAGLELADSITGDAHKMFNVPYDCGIFLSRHLKTGVNVFQNPNAVYLATGNNGYASPPDDFIPSPLNIGIENSRRFRALPVYANLLDYGRDGYRDMLERQIGLARRIATLLRSELSQDFELLPTMVKESEIYVITLWRLKDPKLNANLPQFVQKLNATRKLYVSGTKYAGEPAARFAVANWQVDGERDIRITRKALLEIVEEFKTDHM
ncbi:pyridoxal-dependent decarboxylase [Teratosphaeria nubilosa]|uniref:Pyridoxal-dependent decarboxylase n=1 Tax=Teratosphaeria nubilosa TaxID=161662 RepID=A0A6G1L4X6_9PEZI|nr:pyridoxal-dependent decarboxylase [Teratosphaeria nubilosa]